MGSNAETGRDKTPERNNTKIYTLSPKIPCWCESFRDISVSWNKIFLVPWKSVGNYPLRYFEVLTNPIELTRSIMPNVRWCNLQRKQSCNPVTFHHLRKCQKIRYHFRAWQGRMGSVLRECWEQVES